MIDPDLNKLLVAASIALSAKAKEEAIECFKQHFGKLVIERWTYFRSQNFWQAFVDAVRIEADNDSESANTDVLIHRLLRDTKSSEALYDAYRRVCFSASKTLGPRIIAYLAAKLINDARLADTLEERMFAAAENLTDIELLEFAQRFKLQTRHNKGFSVVRLYETRIEQTNFGTPVKQPGISDAVVELGTWILKLRNIGIVTESVSQEDFGEPLLDKSFQLDRRYSYYLELACEYEELVSLIDRSSGPATEEQN